MKTILSRWLVVGCALLLGGSVHAGNIYVSPNGSASVPGTSTTSPTTIQHGVQIAQAGDTVWLMAGTYTIASDSAIVRPLNSGTSSAPITIRSMSGNADAILDGQSTVPNPATTHWPTTNWHGLIDVIDCSWIVIDGVKVINSGFFGIYVASVSGTASNVTVKNCTTYNTYGSGIAARKATNVKVFSNVVQRACQYPSINIGSGECISMVGVDGFEVYYNTVCDRLVELNNGGEGIDAKDGSKNGNICGNLTYDLVDLGLYTDSWDENNANIGIYGNTVQNCSKGIAIGAEIISGTIQNVSVHDNLVKDIPTRGICISNWSSSGSTCSGLMKDIYIYNNTVVRCGYESVTPSYAGIYIAANHPGNSNFVVCNNIIANNRSQIGATGQSYLTINRNLVFGPNDQTPTMSNTITSDPLFADAANGNYRLTALSPALDCALGTLLPAYDILGLSRPYNGVVDLGAYEYRANTASQGLKADYYANTTFSGGIIATRQEPIMLALGSRAPATGVTAGNFSVRWSGSIAPPSSGTYTFRLRTANGTRRSIDNTLNVNGVKFWLNGELLVDGSSTASPNSNVSAARTLYGGYRYPVMVEFTGAAGNAAAFLDWAYPAAPTYINIPLERLYPITYQEYWRQVVFGTTSNSGVAADLADPDGDGLPNLLEYALYLDANRSQTTGMPTVTSTTTVTNGQLVMSFLRQRAELTYTVQASDDLRTWSDISVNPGTPGNLATVTDSNTTSASRFLRLKVTSMESMATSNPEGRVTVTLSQTTGSDGALSFPLNAVIGSISGRHAGFITAVGANTLSSSVAGWSASQLAQAATPYWLRITSGAAEGRMFLVTANTSTQLTLDTEGVDLTSLGIVAGSDSYELFRAATLASSFPTGKLLSGTSSTGDLLKLHAGGSNWLCYYHDGTNWRSSAGVLSDNVVIRPNHGWHITRRGATMPLVMVGRAPTTCSWAAVSRGTRTYVSLLPVPNTLGEMEWQTLPAWTSSDLVQQWNGSTWISYYYDGTHWRQQGQSGVDCDNTIITKPGLPVMFNRPSGIGADWIVHEKTY